MIAADTSTWIALLGGDWLPDSLQLRDALQARTILMPPMVLTELYSGPHLHLPVREVLASLQLMELRSGFWERAGELRSTVRASKRCARLGDALIAQCCLDHDVPLLTRDRDFLAFAAAAGLEARLFPGSA